MLSQMKNPSNIASHFPQWPRNCLWAAHKQDMRAIVLFKCLVSQQLISRGKLPLIPDIILSRILQRYTVQCSHYIHLYKGTRLTVFTLQFLHREFQMKWTVQSGCKRMEKTECRRRRSNAFYSIYYRFL